MLNLAKDKAGEKVLLLGNEAIARGALEAGMRMFSCYPGTPSSEVAETFADTANALKAAGEKASFRLEYSVNEKVAVEVACGAALAGVRSMAAMKHVGMNVAADPLFTVAYIGVPAGMVVLTADDPGCHSSQNEQDNRQYARFAHLPCFEPASAQEAKDMTFAAFTVAAKLEQPVMLRTTTRISHMRGPVVLGKITSPQDREFIRAPMHYVPVPAVAIQRHPALIGKMHEAAAMSDSSEFNTIKWCCGPDQPCEFGIISSGVARNYLADALALAGWENDVSILELGMTWPLPEQKLSEFLGRCRNVLVLEEGDAILEKDIRAWAQEHGARANISGKDEKLTEFGEYSLSLVLARLARWLGRANPLSVTTPEKDDLPRRPPNLCPGCAHRSVYYAVRRIFGDDAIYSSDIGCYTLGLLPPLKAADFLVCMGSSISAGSGFSCASGKTVVAFLGDSTFFHSGMTGLANAVFNNHDIIMVILDNGTTAMTGHQPNPGMDQQVLGENATHLDIESIVRGLGVKQFKVVKASNLKAVLSALEELRQQKGVRVLLAQEPCVLYARHALGRRRKAIATVKKQGEAAERCLRELACPAFKRENGELAVDEGLCSGCMLCLQIAPEAFAVRQN